MGHVPEHRTCPTIIGHVSWEEECCNHQMDGHSYFIIALAVVLGKYAQKPLLYGRKHGVGTAGSMVNLIKCSGHYHCYSIPERLQPSHG